MEEKTIKQGSLLYKAGDPAEAAYIIVSGRIERIQMVRGQEIQIGVVEAGQSFGENALFDSKTPRAYSVRALQETTVLVLTPDEFAPLFKQCPGEIQQLLKAACDRTAAVQKIVVKTSELVLEDKTTITITPSGDKMKKLIKPVEIKMDALPFRIGGYPEGEEMKRRDNLHLAIPCPTAPLRVSRQHCEIVAEGTGLMVVDLASRFCTTINGIKIGRGQGFYSAALQKGDNEITLGEDEGPYKLTITCE